MILDTENDIFGIDVKSILEREEDALRHLVEQEILLTGSTGFVGTWLLGPLVLAHEKFGGSGRVICVARSFKNLHPTKDKMHLSPSVTCLPSDIRQIVLPTKVKLDLVIHAATPANANLNDSDPLEMISIIIDGQRRALDLALQAQAKKFVFISSGAVYGHQPLTLPRLTEQWSGGPDISNSSNAYHEAKRLAELIGRCFTNDKGISYVVARLFAFLAPFLPMDQHFAAGNFLKDAINGRAPILTSSGKSIRSYQYGSDLSAWLLAVAHRGHDGDIFNVGSASEIELIHLAKRICNLTGIDADPTTPLAEKPDVITKYVPETEKIERRLGVRNEIDLDEAILRTARWAVSDQ